MVRYTYPMSSPLTALSPLDGRYAAKVRPLQVHFSEFALIRERVAIEIEWLVALASEPSFAPLRPFSAKAVKDLRAAAAKFSPRSPSRVKAVEYWLRERFASNREV